jgi:nitrite reductase (NADH) large subunit
MSYLKNVIINDSLGICADLEEEIAGLIKEYKCEWKEVVENQQMKSRFNHFVNAPEEKDPSVTFEPLREQKQAAAW